jgi:hypothetical protein
VAEVLSEHVVLETAGRVGAGFGYSPMSRRAGSIAACLGIAPGAGGASAGSNSAAGARSNDPLAQVAIRSLVPLARQCPPFESLDITQFERQPLSRVAETNRPRNPECDSCATACSRPMEEGLSAVAAASAEDIEHTAQQADGAAWQFLLFRSATVELY